MFPDVCASLSNFRFCNNGGMFPIGFLLKQAGENKQRVAQCAGNHHTKEPRFLIRREIQIGDATTGVEILWIMAGVDRTHRDEESQAVGRGNITATPSTRQRQSVLVVHELCVAARDRFMAQVVLLHPV